MHASFGLAQLQLLCISIQCGATQFSVASKSLLSITPRRIHAADLQMSKLQKSLPVAIIPLSHLPKKRHHCAVTAVVRLDITPLIP